MLRSHLFDPIKGEDDLRVDGRFDPKSTVIVESSDSFCRRNEVRTARLGNALDKGFDLALG